MPYWRLFYHITWATLNRESLVQPHLESDLYEVLTTKSDAMGLTTYAVNGMADHVHLAVAIPPQLAVAECVGQLKGTSSYMINQQYDGTNLKWQRGYGVVSFRQRQLPTVVDYIEGQKEHHAKGAILDVLEQSSYEEDRPLTRTSKKSDARI